MNSNVQVNVNTLIQPRFGNRFLLTILNFFPSMNCIGFGQHHEHEHRIRLASWNISFLTSRLVEMLREFQWGLCDIIVHEKFQIVPTSYYSNRLLMYSYDLLILVLGLHPSMVTYIPPWLTHISKMVWY